MSSPLPFARPLLPDLNTYANMLAPSWDTGALTNFGPLHDSLEGILMQRLGAPLALMNNGTSALIAALRSLNLPEKGEVITTAFTFAATVQSILCAGLTPVLADIDPDTLCLCPRAAEKAITERTCAVLPVHIFGKLANVSAFARLGAENRLKIIYDAAHAFDCSAEGVPVAAWGDACCFSFHATKLFHTIEGGAVAFSGSDASYALAQAKRFRMFGLQGDDVTSIGLNAKLSEVHAAMGLRVLNMVSDERKQRSRVAMRYCERFSSIDGLETLFGESLQYFVLRIRPNFGCRDEIYQRLLNEGIITRRYFYPAACEYSLFKGQYGHFPVAHAAADECLALPFYGSLTDEAVDRIALAIMGR